MDQEEALKVVVAAAELVGRMLEDKKTLEAVEMLRTWITQEPIHGPTLKGLVWQDQSADAGVPKNNWLLATAQIHDVRVHVQAIRVKWSNGLQVASHKTMQNEYDLVAALYDEYFMTTTIPGFKGEYIVYAHPYGD